MAQINPIRPAIRLGRIIGIAASGLCLTAVCLYAANNGNQRTFATPEEAVQAVIQASEHNDVAALRQIFGPDNKDVVESGDPVEDKNDRTEFSDLAHEKLQINHDPANPDRIIFSIGPEEWPFPVPLERRAGKWTFNTASGRMEMLAHRIGENELDVIDVSRGFVEAELEYASRKHDGDGALAYAQRISSSPGKQDGLYWDGPNSLVSKSFAEAVAADQPYHGYHFRILKAQGPAAPGGPLNYVVSGKMIGGFAMVAWPAAYGVSGIKTFVVSHNGVVYEKDLGSGTAAVAKQMTQFNPDSSWREVSLE